MSYFNLATNIDFLEFFGNLNFTIRNLVDIVIIALIIYLAIQLLRETHSIPAVVGVFSIIIFYGLSLFFNLPMTHFVFKSIISIFVIFIVIVFQKELRRFFTSLGSFGLIRKQLFPYETIVDCISHSAFEMARRKLGAIIILPGRESVEPYLEGGFVLNGNVSEPLILSIFDESSPGHDGALIIEGNRVKKFAVHLPLAEKFEKVKNFGLRHRAALGLSQRTDAFIIVISQEKAAVHIFYSNNFYRVYSENELKEKIFEFLRNKFSSIRKVNLLQIIRENLITFIIAFIISFIIWLITSFHTASI